ncbi:MULTISPECIES: hypothetical protein [Halomonadaceae]|uniref:hypothetical protein n=1 Tax=Halomonadaceae TaxID=28256 RepID=UPI00159926D6|nr:MULTISPECIES: hypothetical protein [Halomonas]QJQ95440.1 hypothetical protein HIO72_09240 [Halomonas sp. PA5]
MANDVMLNSADRSIDGEVRDLLGLATSLEALGVRKAETDGNVRYVRDAQTGDMIVAGRDVIVKKTNATLGVLIALPDASQDEVLADLESFTQEMRGTVVGRSQSWVSQRKPG